MIIIPFKVYLKLNAVEQKRERERIHMQMISSHQFRPDSMQPYALRTFLNWIYVCIFGHPFFWPDAFRIPSTFSTRFWSEFYGAEKIQTRKNRMDNESSKYSEKDLSRSFVKFAACTLEIIWCSIFLSRNEFSSKFNFYLYLCSNENTNFLRTRILFINTMW